jgi:hypothetical protein
MPWLWDDFDTYRLRQCDLDEYLVKLFGNYDFLTRVRRPRMYLRLG